MIGVNHRAFAPLAAWITLLLFPVIAGGHGGVVEEDDLCVINIGYLKAHFKIYVPGARGHDDFCEDIPVRGESVFVMEYLHDDLSAAEIDFRIIENVTGLGTFARLEDVEKIDDLDAVTVRYAPSAIVPDVYTLLQPFDADGEYIGIVTATMAERDIRYTAVFPFEVGYTGTGVWPWLLAFLLLLQLNWWWMRRRRRESAAMLMAAALLVAVPGAAGAEEQRFVSADGHFRIAVESELDPVVINRIHAWRLTVADDGGRPVVGASIVVDGGMPAHDHGLPTRPRVIAAEEENGYRIEGLRFHMPGSWEIVVEIDDGHHRDTVTIPLEL